MECWSSASHHSTTSSLQPLDPFPSRISGIQVVPELDVFFILFPAKKNLFAADNGREVKQAAIEVFKLDVPAMKLQQHFFDVGHRSDPTVDRLAAHIASWLPKPTQTFIVFLKFGAKLEHLLQPPSDLGQQLPGLIPSVVLVKPVGHGPSEGLTGLRPEL